MRLTFLGANRQVTGSYYMLEAARLRVLVDCGLFQERPYLERNWQAAPTPAETIDFLILTHAHLDHTGRVPKLVREGLDCPILATPPTTELARIVMLDSARIQEEDAGYKKRRHEREGRRGRHPEVPLYTGADAERVLPMLRPTAYEQPVELNDRLSVRFHEAGHILGSSMLEFTVREDGGTRRLIFSGDIGQWSTPLIRDPSTFDEADAVIMESTYGDEEAATSLAGEIRDAHGCEVSVPQYQDTIEMG